MSNSNAEELFQKVIDAISLYHQQRCSEVCRTITQTLMLACQYGLRQSKHNFGNLSSQIDTLAKTCNISSAHTIAIQRARHHSISPLHFSDEDSQQSSQSGETSGESSISRQELLYDLRAVAVFISAVYEASIPGAILRSTPTLDSSPQGEAGASATGSRYRYVRCMIQSIGDDGIWATVLNAVPAFSSTSVVNINIKDTLEYVDFSYLCDILHEGMQVNLLDSELVATPSSPQREGTASLVPRLVVVEPDFLFDISSLAACFEEYGHHHLLYQLKRLAPRTTNKHILMGNLAGRMLDDIIHQPDAPLAETLRSCFREYALDYCADTDFQPVAFKTEAASQRSNIQACVAELFGKYQRDKAMLEPGFICEQLGIQGRADLITTDMQLLVEQKSGRNINIERNSSGSYGMHIEKHYVQMLLYFAVLAQNFNISPRQISMLLLYSKYQLPRGLIEVAPLQKLLREAVKLRNLIVADEFSIAQNGFQTIVQDLTPDTMNTQQKSGFFWEKYLLPELEKVCAPLQNASPLEHAYFCRMVTFVLKEQLLSKVGSANSAGGEVASNLWNMPLYEKIENGSIYTGLTLDLSQFTSTSSNIPVTTLVFDIPEQGADFLPNFRRGDMVCLYAYPLGEEPDVRKSILHRASISELTGKRLTLHLSNRQSIDTFVHPVIPSHTPQAEGETLPLAPYPLPLKFRYAVEHAPSDINTTTALSGLHRFITAAPDRRALLLGQRPPRHDATIQLTRSYHPSYDDILLRAKQALDYFLLIGPPGTGKTSMALRFLVEEELTNPAAALLLMAYTNRAVDEICDMLCTAGIDFLRIGNEFSCDPRFRQHLLSNAVEQTPTLSAIKQKIIGTRVIVATTATLMSRPYLFSIKSFSLAIVDEASQILEPSIVGLLCLPQIGRFILIGDHKQLPAVVVQNEKESAVDDPLLLSIGLIDCRNSLFERLLRGLNSNSSPTGGKATGGRASLGMGREGAFLGILRRQGRMHPDIAEWPNRMFYPREQLQPVPLPHQEEPTTTPRVIFIPSQSIQNSSSATNSHSRDAVNQWALNEGESSLSDKTNLEEARIVARELMNIYRDSLAPCPSPLAPENSTFDPAKTVGVIVPYRNQIAMIRREIEKLDIPVLQAVSIDTVERYQGSQRDIIIYSFTICHRYQLDFLTANCFEEGGRIIDRKLNVALTRARKRLILTGNEPTLCSNPLFKNLIGYIKEKGGYLPPSGEYKTCKTKAL